MVEARIWLNNHPQYPQYNTPESIRTITSLTITLNQQQIRQISINGGSRIDVAWPSSDRVLDLIGFDGLQTLNCSNNQITSLEISGLTNLRQLRCFNNNLSTLDLSKNVNLELLFCHHQGSSNNSLIRIIGLENLIRLTDITADPFRPINQLATDLRGWMGQFPNNTPQQLKTNVDQAKVFLNEYNTLMGKEREAHRRITLATDVFNETERNDNQRQMGEYVNKIVQVTTLRSKL